ncbi:hypothetical protein [Avibacterium sp. 21-599]|uniref:hypothetical protein n=1 Tax=Avibacterium sp. 21-599 TaxID=2911528 RepID=UPI0022484855|nr:hypothetical protein [Avibacterium sp. 21-599]MCW9718522.1 hypothetical protein [Avibacterium sp. 21-599]
MVDKKKQETSDTLVVFELSKQAGLQSIEDATKFVRENLDEALKKSNGLDKILTKPYSSKRQKGGIIIDLAY